jgi:hypothetical protein
MGVQLRVSAEEARDALSTFLEEVDRGLVLLRTRLEPYPYRIE